MGNKTKRQMEMWGKRTPTKQQADAARRDGTLEKASLLIGLAYLVMSEANNIIEEAAAFLKVHCLELGTLKIKHSYFTAAANQYFHEYSDMFREGGVDPLVYFRDLEELDRLVRKFGGLEERFRAIDEHVTNEAGKEERKEN